jgi:DNA-binding NtrC family response regulator
MQSLTLADSPSLRVPGFVPSFVRSAAMQDAIRGLEAAIDGTGGVLLCGEPGSGRELFARAIHQAIEHRHGSVESLLRRSMQEKPNGRPFVVVDCANREALEERLFGLSRSNEPAVSDLERISEGCAIHAGLGGTLVLRQLPEMPMRMQARLARLLRAGEIWVKQPNGTESMSQVTFRPIATAERHGGSELLPDLETRVSQAIITVPPLRSRREDIPGLVRCVVADLCAAAQIGTKVPSNQAVALLTALPWRGNISELEALLRTLVARVPGRHIRLADVLAHIRLDGQVATPLYRGTLKEAREQFERDYVAAALELHRGRMAEVARALGLQRTNLYRKLRQLSLTRRELRGQLS